ncbi:PREDICTED: purple acid phosphatase 7-like [Tarenaya hassleriana]|uniref:purple acid phosphatase 7-like n=1 Tax=Tarenaya hassleriana TaxID=28532 RepID=UPI00053C29B9|nr:PREDICTED: purple acid phosphatase 7-like [Tarenaya hassleriana]
MRISVVVGVCVFLCILKSCVSEFPRFEHRSTKEDGSLSFLVVGDWGRKGQFNQSRVADQMGRVGSELDIDFVISTGDNFYDEGLTGVNDTAFEESFTRVYTHPSLQKQWYTVLGNHDYMGDAGAQLSDVLAKKDKRWFCRRSFVLATAKGLVEFFFVDTTPFVDKYFTDPGDHTFDWTQVLPRKQYLSNVLHDLEMGLKKSRATWKIVVGHHAIQSAGYHGVTQELVDQILPILEANNVDMYVNGHDHCLQHIMSSKNKMPFLTSGGGSKAWKGSTKQWDPTEMKLYYDGQGFVSFEITHSNAKFVYYDVDGKVLHEWTLSKDSDSKKKL